MTPRNQRERELLEYCYQKLWYAYEEDQHGSSRRKEVLDSYLGRPWKHRQDKSNVQTRELFELVEWVVPTMVKTFMSSPNVVEFVPLDQQDEDSAKMETEAINNYVFRGYSGDGYIDLHAIIKNAILYDNSYIKVHMEETEDQTYEEMRLDSESFMQLQADKDVEITDFEEVEDEVTVDGMSLPVVAYDVKYTVTKTRRKIRIDPLPPEELLVDPSHDHLSLDDCRFVAHRKLKTGSELKAMGINIEKLTDDIGVLATDDLYDDERLSRLFYKETEEDTYYAEKKTERKYWLYEIYLNYDFDNDKKSERRRLRVIGNDIIDNEPISYMPFVSTSCIIMPNAHRGVALAGTAKGLEEEITTLKRYLFDNTYTIARNRKYVSHRAILTSENRLRSIINGRSNLVVLNTSGPVGEAIMDEHHVPIISDVLGVMQDSRSMLPQRTGVAPENNIDPAVLQQATVGAFIAAYDKAGERVELYTRNLAETGLKPIFRKVHYLYRMYPEVAQAYKMGATWRYLEPDTWKDRSNVKVTVGLGFINKQQMISSLMQMMQIQQENPDLTNPWKRYNTAALMAETSGMGQPSDFLLNPEKHMEPESRNQPPQPQPTPEQIQAQAMQEKVQTDAQQAAAELELDKTIKNAELLLKSKEHEVRLLEAMVKMGEAQLHGEDVETRKAELQKELRESLAETRKTNMETGLLKAQIVEVLAQAQKARKETKVMRPEPANGGSDD